MRRVLVGVAVAAVGVTLTACESTSDSGSNAKGVEAVNVKLTKKGCSPARIGVKAGPTTFNVVNDGADAVTEFEVLDGGKILGEKENLTPGLSGKFSLTLKEGKYVTYCPGGSTDERGALVVGGGAAAKATTPQDAALSRQAVTAYKTYVAHETAQLVVATTAFANAVKAGDIEQAKQLYPTARQHYESVEPIAESFGDLDPAIDGREGDVPAAQWTGFHKIEQALWVNNTVDGMAPIADKLVADVTRLNNEIPGLQLEPAQIANGAVDLLNEVSTSKITGEEDRYSHTDLWDFEANVAGAQAAFDALRPIVAEHEPELARQIPTDFQTVLSALATYQQGDGYVTYDKLTKADTRKLAAGVDTLADELAKVPPIVVVQG
jgi:iron uptake system component EfeO